MMTVKRALDSIGKKCFVAYYKAFRDSTDEKLLAERLLRDNPRATSLDAQKTRIRCAKWIFDNKKEREALDCILCSKRVDAQTLREVQRLIQE